MMVVDRNRGSFTCSMINAESDKTLRQLKIGALVWGSVRKIADYGLFLSLDNTFESALLHITNVSWHRVPSMDAIFSPGDRVRAVVIGMDEGFSRISVSTRDLEEKEGDMLSDPRAVYDNAEKGVQRFLDHVAQWEVEQRQEKGVV
jgi:small subunit ribosomal protein S1